MSKEIQISIKSESFNKMISKTIAETTPRN